MLLTAHQIGRRQGTPGDLEEGRQRARRIGATVNCAAAAGGRRARTGRRPRGRQHRATAGRLQAGAASSAQTVLPAPPGVRTTPQSRQSRCTMNMPWPPGRPARCGVRGAGWPGAAVRRPRGAAPCRRSAIRSSSGPSACRQALVTSSETTSSTSSAAARRSAVAAGSQPQSCSACAGEVAGERHDAAGSDQLRACGADASAPARSEWPPGQPKRRRRPAPGRGRPASTAGWCSSALHLTDSPVQRQVVDTLIVIQQFQRCLLPGRTVQNTHFSGRLMLTPDNATR